MLTPLSAWKAQRVGERESRDAHLDIPMRSSYCWYLKTLFRFPSLTLRNSFGQGGLQLGGWWCGHRAVRDDAATTSTESSPVHCLGPDLQAHNALLVCLLLASLPIAAREARAEPAPGSSPDSVSPQSPPDVCAMAAVLRLLTRPPPGPGPTRAKHNLLMESEGGGDVPSKASALRWHHGWRTHANFLMGTLPVCPLIPVQKPTAPWAEIPVVPHVLPARPFSKMAD